MTQNELGAILAQLRKEQGISIRGMAVLAQTSPRMVQAVEKSWYNVGIESYITLASILGVELQIKPIQRKKTSKP